MTGRERSVTRPPDASTQILVDDPDDPAGPGLDDAAFRHLSRSLRLRPGQSVRAVDGAGRWVHCSFDGSPRLVPAGVAGNEPPPGRPVSVAFVPVKGDRPELVVQKLTELGVDRIVITSSDRAVVRWDDERASRHAERLRRVSVEAMQQCRRLWLPRIEMVPFADLLAEGAVLADIGGEATPDASRTVVVGPEGGWTDRERAAAEHPSVSLGGNVLRAETAAIAAGVLLVAARDRRSP